MEDEATAFDPGATAPYTERDLVMARFKASVHRLPRYGRLAIAMVRDDRVPPAARVSLAGGAVYVISPIDLIPGFIPVLGQLDDLLVALVGIRVALGQTPVDVREEHLQRSHLHEDDIDEDLRTVRDTSIYLLKAGAGQVGRVVAQTGRVTWRRMRRHNETPNHAI